MALHIKGKEDLNQAIKNAGSKLVVIDFFATWCGPCRNISPVVDKLAAELSDVVFIKIDVDENDQVAEDYSVSVMPTFIFFKNGTRVFDMAGANENNLKAAIEKYRK